MPPVQWKSREAPLAIEEFPILLVWPPPNGLNEYLHWVLLGLCTVPREDSATSTFEAVYTSDLVLPNQFLKILKTQCLGFHPVLPRHNT